MKKISCPRCGVINLEKFVTFPHCVGCGALLSTTDAATVRTPAWRRPLRVWLWATLLGAGVAVLVAAASLFQARPLEVGQLVVYGRTPRKTRVNGVVMALLTLDTVAPPALRESRALHDVRLRLPRRFLQDFTLLSIEPRPDSVQAHGNGRYFVYASLPREANLHLTLRARRSGRFLLTASFHALRHAGAEYHATIQVAPRVAPPETPPEAPLKTPPAKNPVSGTARTP